MNIEELREYCLAKAGTSESFPFDEVTLVFKVMGKMFALSGLGREVPSVNLKCDPVRAEELRESYADIQPGYHMSKIHWNTVNMEGELDDRFLEELVDHSYDLVVSKLTKKLKVELQELQK